MSLFDRPIDWLVDRYGERTLAKAAVVLVVIVLANQVFFVWYFGNVGLSLREMSHGSDDRTVVIDAADVSTVERQYRPDSEEGWCLYGSTNATHVRVEAVLHADALAKRSDRIEFTCVPETAERLASGGSARLVGVLHSHPSRSESRLSRVDTMTWGRVSPLVEVMGVYTVEDGVEFFTIESLVYPLDKRVVGRSPSDGGGDRAAG